MNFMLLFTLIVAIALMAIYLLWDIRRFEAGEINESEKKESSVGILCFAVIIIVGIVCLYV